MLPGIDLPRALLRGRYMKAAATMEGNGVPIDTTTWQQLIDVARKVRLNDTEIPRVAA